MIYINVMNTQFILENRFDIKIKLFYLQDREKWSYLYFYHLLLWGGGKIYEWDGSKSCYSDFLTAFDTTYQSIKENGFKGKIKAILDGDNIYPIEGAHRIASCIHLGVEPEFEIIQNWRGHLYNEDYFRKLGMLESEIIKVNNAFDLEWSNMKTWKLFNQKPNQKNQ